MSGYKALVKAYWVTYRPGALAALAENTPPETFFARVSDEIAERIAEYRDDFTPPGIPGADFRDRMREINMATLRAREKALHELLYGLPKEPGTEGAEMPGVALPKIAAW
ncbi:hypothetical protein OIB37_12540 [Streptomyces sp. NBC_00820]|uniref:hypothetical protein n=1 Tax=Streptomyces sp. NBC_00820 TaxID=2975842 RepID=UPI002ED56582|nr:hypothetical protein OIB37_12540 [Streptomyces sp. NBC_00820]